MRKALILPAVAVFGGLIGLVVRQRFLVQAFEPDTGLPVGGVPVAYAMWAVALITAGAIVALSLGKHRTFEKAYTINIVKPIPLSYVLTLRLFSSINSTKSILL